MTRRLYSRLLSNHVITRRLYCDALVGVPSLGGFIVTTYIVHVPSLGGFIMILGYI